MNEVAERLKRLLSYSETQVLKAIFDELKADEAVLVVGNIAKQIGNARSVAISGLKLLEAAGVAESKSLGRKGLYLRVTDRETLDKLFN